MTGTPMRDDAAADRSGRRHYAGVLGALSVLAVIAAGDLVLIKSTLDRALRLNEVFSWTLGVGLTVSAVALMFQAGAQTRTNRIHSDNSWPARATVRALMLLWVAVGLGLFTIRWNAQAFSPAQAVFENTAVSDSGAGSTSERLLAAVLLTVYAATGCLAWVDGHRLSNPAAAAARQAGRLVSRLEHQVAVATAELLRLHNHIAIHEDDLTRVESDLALAKAAHAAKIEELKDQVRLRVAEHLGDPESTDLLIRPSTAEANPGAVQ